MSTTMLHYRIATIIFFGFFTWLHGRSLTEVLETPYAKIMDGSKTDISRVPYEVLIHAITQRRGNLISYKLCGGGIIAPDWVLTAAHCVVQNGRVMSPRNINVYAGTNDGDASTLVKAQTRNVKSVSVAPEYDVIRATERPIAGDIALIRVDRSFNFDGPNVKSVSLPPAHLTVPNGASAVVAGYGQTGNEDDKIELRIATLQRVNCGAISRPRTVLCFNGVRSGDTQSITCNGDSGSPLVFTSNNHKYLVGVVSGGFVCDVDYKTHLPAIFTDVKLFLTWIKKVTGI